MAVLSEIDWKDCVLPLYWAIQDGEAYRRQDFAGSCFFINSLGGIATCRHVVEPRAGLNLVAFYHDADHRVDSLRCHQHYDIAFATLNGVCGNRHLSHFNGTPHIGMEISAFGYVAAGHDERKNISTDERILLGHISRITRNKDRFRPSGDELYEVSFPSLSGFSGAPIRHNAELLGILFDNLESSITVSSIEEVKDDGAVCIERVSRIIEFGIAHSLPTFDRAWQDLGVKAFI